METSATPMDLSEQDAGSELVLRGATFSGQSDTNATTLLLDVVDCELDAVDLSGIDLSGSRFKNCQFTSCVFDQCRLNDVSMTGCELSTSSLVGLQLSQARLVDCTIAASKFVSASIFRSTIDNCTFQETNLRGAKIYETSLTKVSFWSCDLQEVTFSDVTVGEQLDLRGSAIADSHGLATVHDLLVDHAQGAALASWLMAQQRIAVRDLPETDSPL